MFLSLREFLLRPHDRIERPEKAVISVGDALRVIHRRAAAGRAAASTRTAAGGRDKTEVYILRPHVGAEAAISSRARYGGRSASGSASGCRRRRCPIRLVCKRKPRPGCGPKIARQDGRLRCRSADVAGRASGVQADLPHGDNRNARLGRDLVQLFSDLDDFRGNVGRRRVDVADHFKRTQSAVPDLRHAVGFGNGVQCPLKPVRLHDVHFKSGSCVHGCSNHCIINGLRRRKCRLGGVHVTTQGNKRRVIHSGRKLVHPRLCIRSRHNECVEVVKP